MLPILSFFLYNCVIICPRCYEKYITHPNHANPHHISSQTQTQSHINSASTLVLGRRRALPDTAVVAMVQSELSSILASLCLIGRDCKTSFWMRIQARKEAYSVWYVDYLCTQTIIIIIIDQHILPHFKSGLSNKSWFGLLHQCNMILV